MTDLYVAKLPDRAIIALVVELKERFGGNVTIDLGGVRLREDGYEKIIQTKGPTYFIKSFAWHSDPAKFNVNMDRANVRDGLNPAYYDFISFSPQSAQLKLDDILDADKIIKKHATFPRPGDVKELAKDTIGIIDRETAALSQLHVVMLENAEELRLKYESDAALRRQQFEEQQIKAEEEIRRREAESLDRISTERTALDEKFKQFDQSDHMFARRRLREDITSQVQEFTRSPLSTPQSSKKFWSIVALCIASCVGTGILAYESFESFVSHTQVTATLPDPIGSQDDVSNVARRREDTYLIWMLAVRGAVSSAVCVGFAVYLISMLRKSYDNEVRTLHEFQRYGMDINRASWVIETAMEMTTKEGAALPERWIEGACAGLFQTDNKKETEVSSLAALGAVMGLGPEVTVGPGGASFKIPSKGAKKAANDAD